MTSVPSASSATPATPANPVPADIAQDQADEAKLAGDVTTEQTDANKLAADLAKTATDETAQTTTTTPPPPPPVTIPPVPLTPLVVGISLGDAPLINASDAGLSQYKAMKTAGFVGVRIDAPYPNGPDEASVEAALAAGEDVLLIADGIWNMAPPTPAQFAAFGTTLAQTYAPKGIHFYETINEPGLAANFNEPQNVVNPIAYTALAKAFYAAVHAADPKALVVLGGNSVFTSSDGASVGNGNYTGSLLPGTFLAMVYAANGGTTAGLCDAVGMHPYAGNAAPSAADNWGVFLNPVGTPGFYAVPGYTGNPSLRAIMAANGESTKPIWITEVGYETSGDSSSVTDAVQATDLVALLNAADAIPQVTRVYLFNWADDGDGDWGEEDDTNTPKPALAAVSSWITGIPTTTPPVTVPVPAQATEPTATVTGNTVAFTWPSLANAATYDITLDKNAPVSVTGTAVSVSSVAAGSHTATVAGVNSAGVAGKASVAVTFTVEPIASTNPVPSVPASVAVPQSLTDDYEFTADTSLPKVFTPNWFGDGSTQNGTKMYARNVSFQADGLHLTLATDKTGGLVSTNPGDTSGGHVGKAWAPTPTSDVFWEVAATLPGKGSTVMNWIEIWLNGQVWPVDKEADMDESLSGSNAQHFHWGQNNSSVGASENIGPGKHVFGLLWRYGNGMTFYVDAKPTLVVPQSDVQNYDPLYLVLGNSLPISSGVDLELPTDLIISSARVFQGKSTVIS